MTRKGAKGTNRENQSCAGCGSPMYGETGDLNVYRVGNHEQCYRCWKEKHDAWLEARSAARAAKRAEKDEARFVRMLRAFIPHAKEIARLEADLASFIALQPAFVEQKPGAATRVRVLRNEIQRFKGMRAQDEQEYQRLKDLAVGEDEIKRLRILMLMLETETATVAPLRKKKVEAYPAALGKVNFT
jgi:hypothetical protein